MQRYKRHNAEQWQSLVNDHAKSGLSAVEFCKQYHLGYASFCAWRKKLSSHNVSNDISAPAFVELIQPEPEALIPAWVVELQVGENMILRIAKG